MAFSKAIKYCLLTIFILNVYGHTADEPMCAHGLYEIDTEPLEVDEDFIVDDGRNLQTTTYPAFRIKADFTRMTEGTDEFKVYVENDLMPPVVDYFQAALKIKQPLTSVLKSTSTIICGGYTLPTLLKNGVSTDFFVLVTSTEDDLNWVASAGACTISSTTKRPLIARMMFNLVYTKAANGDVLLHEKNMYLTMHEMMHALGFAASSFANFIDSAGKTLTGHIKTVTINGASTWTVLDVEPLTTKLRTHFGCSTLPGAFMEDEGGAGTEGSHFERRHFIYEVMTSGVIHGRRISEFSLAVLEGSGWYMPNYTYAEPFYFGQGQGCNFLYQNCSDSTFNYEDFCYDSSRGCTQVGRGGGVCSTDTRSNQCRYNIPNANYDCENENAVDYARHPTKEVFGRDAGSKCFSGNLTTAKSSTPTSFCFKFNCVGTGLTTKLEVLIGTTKVTCTKESQISVTGFNGLLNCPDPLTYCSTVGKKYCPRSCLGRGDCVDGQCKCKTGYTGVDCAFKA